MARRIKTKNKKEIMVRRIKAKNKKEKRTCLDPVVTPTLFFVIKNAIGGMIAFFTVEMFKKFKNKKK